MLGMMASGVPRDEAVRVAAAGLMAKHGIDPAFAHAVAETALEEHGDPTTGGDAQDYPTETLIDYVCRALRRRGVEP